MWNETCFANLTTYLKRKEVRALGKPAIVVKGCDERALVVLEKESQVERAEMHVIGMACQGMGQPKCAACDTRLPRFADETIAGGRRAGAGADRRPLCGARRAACRSPPKSGWRFGPRSSTAA